MEVGKQLILYGSLTLLLSLVIHKPGVTVIAAVVILIGIIKTIINHKERKQ